MMCAINLYPQDFDDGTEFCNFFRFELSFLFFF